MMKKFGMPTLIEFESFDENLAFCLENELKLIELNMDLPQFQADGIIKQKFTEDIEISLHLPEETDVWSFTNAIRQAHLYVVEDAIDVAIEKSIKILNMHLSTGVYFTLPHGKTFLNQRYLDVYLDNTRKFAEAVSSKLDRSGTKLHIENTGIYDQSFVQKALGVLLEYDCFSLTYDIGHDFANDNHDAQTMRHYSSRIGHMHLHDAKEGKDHLAFGDGDIDLAAILEDHDNVRTAILETKTSDGILKSIQYLKDNGAW